MTNLYIDKDVYEKIDTLVKGDFVHDEYKHPFSDDLIIVHPKFPYTNNERPIQRIVRRDDGLIYGYVDIYDDRGYYRYEIKPVDYDGLWKQQEDMHRDFKIGSVHGQEVDQTKFTGANVFFMGVLTVMMLNQRLFDKETINRPKVWKRRRKRYKDHCGYDSHYLVKIGRTYNQVDIETLTNTTELRYHMRRGHWRFIPSKGEKVWIKPYWAGNKNLGTITKDYKT